MDSSNIITENYELQNNVHNDLPMNVTFINELDSSVSIQNYVIKHLDDGNLELVFCNDQDLNEEREKNQSIIDADLPYVYTQQNEAVDMDLNLDSRIKTNKFGVRSVEVPVIRSFQKDSVIHHASTLPQLPNPTPATTQPKIRNNPISIVSRPEKILLNVTIYSCFKCKEPFNSLTLFRQHLKWHKTEKNFNCSKCAAGFYAENNLKIHMVTSHPGHHTDVCPICKIKFQRKASLKSHIMMHQVEEIFTCEECHGEFQNDDELLKHMEIHAVTRVTNTLSDSLVCPYCKLDFDTLADYKRHVEKHLDVKRNVLKGKKVRKKKPKEKPGGYKCKYCSKLFSKGGLLERHERIHTGERPYACTYCNRAFSQKGTLQIHLGSHTGVKPYSCTLCQAKFTQKGNLRAHIEKTHTAPKGNQKIYRCTQCPCIFRKVASLNGHITKVHINQDAEETESENIINKVMGSLKMLNNELGKSALKKDEPKQPAPPPSPPKTTGTTSVRLAESHANGGVRRYLVRQKKIGDVRWYFCNFCSSRFKKPSDLIRHFRTHTLEKPYQCTKCNQAFSLKSTLLNHYKTHSSCQCSRCDIRFRNPRNLEAHVRSHATEVETPNYVCLLCEDVFFTMEEGKRHRSVHEGEIQSTQNVIEPILKQPLYETTYGSLPLKPPKSKIPNTGAESPLERPHQCKGCGARFPRLLSLKRHLLCHSGERKFKCTLCPKTFTTKYRLKEHTNYHKNIRNYHCQTCGKKFVTASLLKRHTIVHNNFKPYLCPYCNKHFKTLLLCRSHIKTVHKLKVYLENGEEAPEDTENIEMVTDVLSESTNLTAPSNSGKYTKEDNFPSKLQKTSSIATESTTTNPSQNSVMLSVTPHENQQESNPGYQMVYLNIDDLPMTNPDGVLGGNSLSSLKIQNDSLLFNSLNDLQDSTALFNIDANKSDMVDPNEVLQSMNASSYTTSPSVISRISQNTSNLGKLSDMATRRRGDSDRRGNDGSGLGKEPLGDLVAGESGIDLQEFSAMDLDGLPISIIGTEDTATLSTSMANGEMNINPNDMFFDAQVICINCHKVFSDMNVFQKHACSQDPNANATENLNLLIQNNEGENTLNETVEKVYSSTQRLLTRAQNPSFKCTNIDDQEVENDHIDSMLEDDSGSPKEALLENDEVYMEKLKRFKYKKPLLKDIERLVRTKEFWCKECNYLTTVEERYRKHMSYMHVQSMEKVCKYCYKEFKKLSDLVRHVRTHTGERPYECERCHKKFSLKSTLESHLRTHNMSMVTKICCDVCNSNFTTKSSLKVHMLLHTGARPHNCNFCEQTFRTSAIRKAHERNMHLNKSKQAMTNKPKSGRRLLKSVAEEVANDVRSEKDREMGGANISTGTEVSTSDALILNSVQDSVAIDPVILLQNLQNSGIILTTDGEGSVPLNLNDITLLDYETLKVGNDSNISFIGDMANFQYSHIGKTFDPHREENSGKLDTLPYVQFASSGDNEYEKTEPAPKPQKIVQKVVQKVECDICHKMYASKDVLRKHKKNVHGQNKKFPCIKCDKGYDSLEELNKHIVKLHTGYRPYACNYCANSFSEENSLKTHIKRIHQKSLIAQETTNALLGLQFDLPMVSTNNTLNL